MTHTPNLPEAFQTFTGNNKTKVVEDQLAEQDELKESNKKRWKDVEEEARPEQKDTNCLNQ